MNQRNQHAKLDRLRKPRSAGILKIVEWSDEDRCFVGSAPPLIGPACHGSDETKVYQELCRIVDEWLEILEQDGAPIPPATLAKEYSGKFHLRAGRDLRKALEVRATQARESLNGYCVRQLTEAVRTPNGTVASDSAPLRTPKPENKRETVPKSGRRRAAAERNVSR